MIAFILTVALHALIPACPDTAPFYDVNAIAYVNDAGQWTLACAARYKSKAYADSVANGCVWVATPDQCDSDCGYWFC